MKLSDINQELTEAAEEFGAKQGLGKRLGAKIRKKVDPRKDKRRAASAEDNLRTQAKNIKTRFAEYMATEPKGTEPTIDHIEEFLSDTEYAEYVSPIAIKLKMKKSVEEPSQDQGEPTADDSVDQTADEVGSKEHEDLISPEEMTDGEKPKRELTPDEQAGFDKINKDAEDEAAEFEKQDVKASKGDDKEPKIDTSASIYEARLRNMLTELKDNEIDTLLYRIVQAQAKKAGPPKQAPAASTKTEPKAKPEADSDKKSIWKSDLGDLARGKRTEKGQDIAEPSGGGSGEATDAFLDEYRDELEAVLTKVKAGTDLDKRDQRNASNMLRSL